MKKKIDASTDKKTPWERWGRDLVLVFVGSVLGALMTFWQTIHNDKEAALDRLVTLSDEADANEELALWMCEWMKVRPQLSFKIPDTTIAKACVDDVRTFEILTREEMRFVRFYIENVEQARYAQRTYNDSMLSFRGKELTPDEQKAMMDLSKNTHKHLATVAADSITLKEVLLKRLGEKRVKTSAVPVDNIQNRRSNYFEKVMRGELRTPWQ